MHAVFSKASIVLTLGIRLLSVGIAFLKILMTAIDIAKLFKICLNLFEDKILTGLIRYTKRCVTLSEKHKIS